MLQLPLLCRCKSCTYWRPLPKQFSLRRASVNSNFVVLWSDRAFSVAVLHVRELKLLRYTSSFTLSWWFNCNCNCNYFIYTVPSTIKQMAHCSHTPYDEWKNCLKFTPKIWSAVQQFKFSHMQDSERKGSITARKSYFRAFGIFCHLCGNWTDRTVSGLFATLPVCPQDVSPSGRLATWTIHPLDHSPPRCFATWLFCHLDHSPYTMDDLPLCLWCSGNEKVKLKIFLVSFFGVNKCEACENSHDFTNNCTGI